MWAYTLGNGRPEPGWPQVGPGQSAGQSPVTQGAGRVPFSYRVARPGQPRQRGERDPPHRYRPGPWPDYRVRHRLPGQAASVAERGRGHGDRGYARPLRRGLGCLDARRSLAADAGRGPDRDGSRGRRAGRAFAEQPGCRRRLRGHPQRVGPPAYRRVAWNHRGDGGGVSGGGAGHWCLDRRAAGLLLRLRRTVDHRPDPPQVLGPGRTGRAHARRDPPGPAGRESGGRARRADQDCP